MEQNILINKASTIIDIAAGNQSKGFTADALADLVKLRVLLNAQPELDTGGASTAPPAPDPAPKP